MTNQTFTTPCGKTYHVGQVFDTVPDELRGLKGFSWLALMCAPPKYCITALPPQPEPEPKTVKFEVLDGVKRIYYIDPVTGAIESTHGGYLNSYLLKLHIDAGGKLYKTQKDAERGKALGWK